MSCRRSREGSLHPPSQCRNCRHLGLTARERHKRRASAPKTITFGEVIEPLVKPVAFLLTGSRPAALLDCRRYSSASRRLSRGSFPAALSVCDRQFVSPGETVSVAIKLLMKTLRLSRALGLEGGLVNDPVAVGGWMGCGRGQFWQLEDQSRIQPES